MADGLAALFVLVGHGTPDVFEAISEAISIVSQGKHDPHLAHDRIKNLYDWAHIARRTEVVYENVMGSEEMELWTRMKR